MASKITEQKWLAVPTQTLTSNGTLRGNLLLSDTTSFKVGMVVQLSSNTQPPQNLQVKRVLAPSISLGPTDNTLNSRVDISAFLVADSASILALEQDRVTPGQSDVFQAAFAEEPTLAHRNLLVDEDGCAVGTVANPINVAGGGGGGPGGAVGYESILPLLANTNWLKLMNPETISVSTIGTVNTLSYSEDGNEVAELIVDFTDLQNWDMALNAWVNDADGVPLDDDDFTQLNLD